jgi:glyoxylase-like metal-dependent hydrolase (beta-lactamase superfamily II)
VRAGRAQNDHVRRRWPFGVKNKNPVEAREMIRMLTRNPYLITRRGMLAGASSLAAGGLVGEAARPAFAKAPLLQTRAPAFYRFDIGNIQATVISDGPLNFKSTIFRGAPDDQIKQLLADDFVQPDAVRMEQNILLLNTGDKLLMIDTGMLSMKAANAPSGRILESLAEAGFDPKDIDAIILSHPHIDHAAGIMSADGQTRLFPNAQIYTTEADFKFWTNEQLLGTPAEFSARTAMKNLLPNKDRLVMYKDGQEIFPGIQAIFTPGHTVGHSSFMITSAGKSLCYTGDVVLHDIMLRNPKVAVTFDTDSQQGVATRIKTLDMLSADKIPSLVYHMPWPGIGHIVKDGDGYRFVQIPILPVL